MSENHLYEITQRLHNVVADGKPPMIFFGLDYPDEQIWAAMIHYGMEFPDNSRKLLELLDSQA